MLADILAPITPLESQNLQLEVEVLRLLNAALERLKARGKQRTDSTHVLAAVHDPHLLELVVETLRAALA